MTKGLHELIYVETKKLNFIEINQKQAHPFKPTISR